MAGVDDPEFRATGNTVIWRYMTLERYHDLLAGQLYFSTAHQFDDQFEGAITDAEIAWRNEIAATLFPGDPAIQQAELKGLSRAFGELRRLTTINCWHARPAENIAMWERYLRRSPGVAVASTVAALKQSLQPFRLQPDYGEERIVVGRVRYLDYTAAEKTNRSMLGIFFHKRAEFSDESEVRAVLSLRMAEEFGVPVPDDGVIVNLDPAALLHQIRCWPTANEAELASVLDATRAAGVQCAVHMSALAQPPTY